MVPSLRALLMLLLVVASVALAGCATDGGEADATSEGADSIRDKLKDVAGHEALEKAKRYGQAEAGEALREASQELPSRFSMVVEMLRDDEVTLTIQALFEQDRGMSYLLMTGDFSALDQRGAAGAFDPGDQGLVFYTTPAASIMIIKDTAYNMGPPDDRSADGAEAFGFSDPAALFDTFAEGRFNVTDVEPLLHGDEAALRITVVDDASGTQSRFILLVDAKRVVHVETTIPEGDQSGAFAGMLLRGELFYDDDVTLEVPEVAVRASMLAFERAVDASNQSKENWTFAVDSDIRLDEVELVVKDNADGKETDYGSLTTLASMSLDEGTLTHERVTAGFTDADGDGLVSSGDILRITWVEADATKPNLALFDTVTQTYVVPGVALWALLGLVGVVALSGRRP